MAKKDSNNIGEYILIGVILFGLIFFMFIAPCAVAYGVISGQVNIETLEPIRNEVDYEGN